MPLFAGLRKLLCSLEKFADKQQVTGNDREEPTGLIRTLRSFLFSSILSSFFRLLQRNTREARRRRSCWSLLLLLLAALLVFLCLRAWLSSPLSSFLTLVGKSCPVCWGGKRCMRERRSRSSFCASELEEKDFRILLLLLPVIGLISS